MKSTVGVKDLMSLDSRRSRAIAASLTVAGLIGLSLLSSSRESSADPTGGATAALANASGVPVTVGQASSTDPVTADPRPGNMHTTLAAPTTTRAPSPAVCGSDHKAGFGCPIAVDTFDGSSVDPNAWGVYDFPDANFPRIASNLKVQDGEVKLIGTYDQKTGKILGAGMASQLDQKYGRWETRVKVDKGKGFSAASLLWPKTERWPTDGEVDLFEIPRSTRSDVYQVIHNGVRNNTGQNKFNMDATQWHTYAVEWTPTKISYYVDDKLTWTVTKAALIPSTSDMHITLQMDPGTPAECGRWFECPNSTTPAETVMHVDYVKIWDYQG